MDPTGSSLWPRGQPTFVNISEAAVANLSQTLRATEQQAIEGFQYSGTYLKGSLIDVAILTMFFGMSYPYYQSIDADSECAQDYSLFLLR